MMGKRNPLNDENFVSVLSEVVWGLHVYGRYGGEQKKADKPFQKEFPGILLMSIKRCSSQAARF